MKLTIKNANQDLVELIKRAIKLSGFKAKLEIKKEYDKDLLEAIKEIKENKTVSYNSFEEFKNLISNS